MPVAPVWNWPELPDAGDGAGLKAWLQGVNTRLNRGFADHLEITHIVYGRAQAMDRLVLHLWRHHAGSPENLALLAVGGYGRGELHPYSDLDLLILLDAGEPPPGLSEFVTALWDLKLEVGHALRTVDECVQESRDNVATATTLMEIRLLDGNSELRQRLEAAVAPDQVWQGAAYFQAKLAEQKGRHEHFGGTAYNLEPNLKEGPGGLRDIQTVAWVAKRHYGARTLAETAKAGFLTDEEYQALMQGQRYLWRVRYGLHLAAGRKENRLLFDHQRTLARQFGMADSPGNNLAVEQFMQDYFRRVMQLERLNERLLQAFDEDILGSDRGQRVELVDEDFQVVGGYLQFARPDPLPDEPLLLLKLFKVLQERPGLRGVRAETLRQVRTHRKLIDDRFRQSKAARKLFGDLWRDGRELPRILEQMHRYEVLDAYLPVFRQIVGRMQFDLFHVYTVDQHTLEVMKYVHRFATRRDDGRYPMAHDLFRTLSAPELLYLAAFFHDIAKGRGGDHSELGERDALAFCAAHGFSDQDAALVGWLVRHHLLMSTTAQRRDIADPAVVNQFADLVANRRRLTYLYLLTLADISGTSAKLWNSWKARLLSELYMLTRRALERGPDQQAERADIVADTRTRATLMLARSEVCADQRAALWANLTDEYFLRHTPDQIAWHARELLAADTPLSGPDVQRVVMRPAAESGAAELLVYAPNIDGTFAAIVQCLGRSKLSVVDARGFTTRDGNILDTFLVLDSTGSARIEPATADRLTGRICSRLAELPTLPAEPDRTPLPARLKPFQRQTRLTFRADAAGRFTEMELIGSDRPGLLALVAGTLVRCKVRIHGMRVVTLGDRVEDVFVISDRADQPLSKAACDELQQALEEALEN